MSAKGPEPHVVRLVELFETLTPADIVRLPLYYASDVQFKDPFNEVHGVIEVQRVFDHMFAALESPRFVVHDVVGQSQHCFLTWDMHFGLRRFTRTRQSIRGASHLVFNVDGLVARHRDYWDAAEELYQKLPVLGALLNWLKRRISQP